MILNLRMTTLVRILPTHLIHPKPLNIGSKPRPPLPIHPITNIILRRIIKLPTPIQLSIKMKLSWLVAYEWDGWAWWVDGLFLGGLGQVAGLGGDWEEFLGV
jgi:hypothetical protein